MVVVERESGRFAEAEIGEEFLAIEQSFRISVPGAHQLALHALVFFFAQRVADLALEQASAAKMLEIAPCESAAPEDHCIDLAPCQAGDGEAFVDRFIGHPPAVDLAPGKALERDRRNHSIIVEQASGGLVISGVDTENNHARFGLDGLRTAVRRTYRPLPPCVNPSPGASRGANAHAAVCRVPIAVLHHVIC